jgi:hypothetical protein
MTPKKYTFLEGSKIIKLRQIGTYSIDNENGTFSSSLVTICTEPNMEKKG